MYSLAQNDHVFLIFLDLRKVMNILHLDSYLRSMKEFRADFLRSLRLARLTGIYYEGEMLVGVNYISLQ